MDRGGKHQRNQLVSLTEGELCQEKTRWSKSSCYNQVYHQIIIWHGFIITHELLYKLELLTFIMVEVLLHLYNLKYYTIAVLHWLSLQSPNAELSISILSNWTQILMYARVGNKVTCPRMQSNITALKLNLPLWHYVEFLLQHSYLVTTHLVSISFIISFFSFPLSKQRHHLNLDFNLNVIKSVFYYDFVSEELKLGFEKDDAFSGMQSVVLGTKEHNVRATLPAAGLSVEKQVDCLLDQAMDPNVLGRVWVGWEPWIWFFYFFVKLFKIVIQNNWKTNRIRGETLVAVKSNSHVLW